MWCMACRRTFLLFLLAVAFVATAASTARAAVMDSAKEQWLLTDGEVDAGVEAGNLTAPVCDGLVGDCIYEDEEMEVGTETARRGLRGRRRFISYYALLKNRVPCSRRGQSYYNCRPQARVNPYRRACTVITGCARFLE